MTIHQTEIRRSVVPLIEGEHDDIQVICLEGDRFMVTAQQAINLLSIVSNAVAFQAQLKDALALIADWIKERKQHISSAYVVLTSHNILFLVVQREVKFNFELEDAMVELDIELANSDQTSLIPMQTLLVSSFAASARWLATTTSSRWKNAFGRSAIMRTLKTSTTPNGTCCMSPVREHVINC